MKEKIIKAVTNIKGYHKFLKAIAKMEVKTEKLQRQRGELWTLNNGG